MRSCLSGCGILQGTREAEIFTKPRPTPCMKKMGRGSASVLSSPSSERSEEKESPRLWMMLFCRSSPALLQEHQYYLSRQTML